MNNSILFILLATSLIATSQPRCGRNEVYNECSSACEAKCGQEEPMACIMMCGPPKCQCAQGFFRHASGRCVSPAQC